MPRRHWIDFASVRGALSFRDVLSHYAIDHPKGQTQFKISCPFHEEKSPSCSINTSRGIFKCFGCDAKGNALDFIILQEGGELESHEDRYRAAELAIEIIGRDPKDFGRGAAPSKSSKAKSETAEDDHSEVMGARTSKGDEGLPASNPVFDRVLQLQHDHPFLAGRGISPSLAETYGIGFCPKGIMKDRIAIPIHNGNSDLVGYVGRWAEEEVPGDIDRYKFPKRFQKSLELWNLHRALELEKRYIVLVEGYWSAIRLHELTIPCAALMGTSVSKAQAKLLRDNGIRYAVLMLDGDEAGKKAMPAAVHVLSQHVYVRVVALPEGEKPGSVPHKFLEKFL